MHCKSYSHFFSKKFQHICVSLDLNFNESLTNDVVSFEQLGPNFLLTYWTIILLNSALKFVFFCFLFFQGWFTTHCTMIVKASVAQLDAPSDWRPGGRGFNPRRGRQHSFVEIDHEIFSVVILSLPLIQKGQLSVSGERICTILVNRLED